MDSSVALVQAASGLQKTMSGTSGTILKDSTVAQISAAVYYQAKVVSKLTTNKQFQSKFHTIVFKQLEKDFNEYVDAQARMNPKSLHHVYEWKKVGNKNARLFDLKIVGRSGLSFMVSSDFKQSKSMVPTSYGNSRHVFKSKAYVIEKGLPVVIRPKASKRLTFEIDGLLIRMPVGKSVTVNKPGGGKATGRFKIAYARFFTGNLVSLSIKRSGFQQLFNSSMSKAMNLPPDIKKVKYSFSPNTIDMQADLAISAAFGASSVG